MDTRKWIAVLGTMLGAFMAVLDIQVTNSSLADISGGIAATPDEGSWITTSYLIGEIITIALTAWLSEVFTLRWYLLGNIVLFLLFSVLCGFSTSLGEIIFFRVGQGFTGGVFIPMAQTVVATMMPKKLQPVGYTILGLSATLAPAVGPALGGWLTDQAGWQWNFFINLLPGAFMFAAVAYAIPAEKMRLGKLTQGDWVGILSLAVGLGSLIAMLEEGQRHDWFGSAFIRNCGILVAIFVPTFVGWEIFVARQPLIKLRLLANRNLGLSTLVAFVLGLGFYGYVFLIPQFLAQVQNYSPLLVGKTLIWIGLPQLLMFALLPLAMQKLDLRLIVCLGAVVFAYGAYLNTHMTPDYGRDQFFYANIVVALGQPFTFVPVVGLTTATLARTDASQASAIFNMFRNLGGSFGIAVLSTVTTRREQFHDFRIGERVSAYDLAVRERLQSTQAQFVARGFDADTAMKQAYGVLKMAVRKSAQVMSYNDAFLVVALGLLVGGAVVWFCQKPDPAQASAAAA